MKTERIVIKTRDRQDIALDHHHNGGNQVIVLAHGFYNNKDAYLFKGIAGKLAESFDAISFDFRGHGKSSGYFSWTSQEPDDLAAVLYYAVEKGYEKIGVIGFSLGAAIAIVEASRNKKIDSLMTVSAPYDLWKINFHFWEPEMLSDLKLNLGIKGKGKFIRPGNFLGKKTRPIDVVNKISPVPICFMHGAKDWLIKPEHSEKLFKKAGYPKKLLIIDEAGHAEKIFDAKPDEFIRECDLWFKETLAVL